MNICSDKLTNVCGIVNGTEIIIIIIIIAISDFMKYLHVTS